MNKIQLNEQYGTKHSHRGRPVQSYQGELEFIIKSTKTGKVVKTLREHNLIKISAKEILSHRLSPTNVWDPTGGTGSGAWINSGIEIEEFSPKYILFGASFDADGSALDTDDPRYYTTDAVTGAAIPITLGVGAEYDGGLINAIPLADPNRPLKKVESVTFESSYQPAGTPLLQDDVRAMNNIVVLETTLLKEEYNGPGTSSSDFYTVAEVALAGGREIDSIGACECSPNDLFLEGRTDGTSITATANGTATITIDPGDVAFVDVIAAGDQVKIVDANETGADTSSLDMVTPYFLAETKAVGGSDITLDRTPTDSDGNPLTGTVGIFKSGLRIFSHRVLKVPFVKSDSFEITTRWRLILN